MTEKIKRDRWGRPMIPDPTTGKVIAWTRATTLAGTISDRWALEKWAQRNIVKGFALREDLVLRASAAGDDRDALDKVAQAASEAANSSSAADIGTALHSITEKLDGGEEVDVPSRFKPDVDAYQKAMADSGLRVMKGWIERFVVVPEVKAAGTPDRLLEPAAIGLPMIGDLKGLALDTPLPTPSGWTTMGEVKPGDELFGSDGRPCRVVAKSEIHLRPCHQIVFDDGTSVVCDDEHRWLTHAGYGQPGSNTRSVGVRTTREIADTVIHPVSGQRHHTIPNTKPLECDESELIAHPYVFGCWLGDGRRDRGDICKPDDELWENIKACGYAIGSDYSRNNDRARTHTVIGLVTQLRTIGALGTRRIPDNYLRASINQRVELLRGLMDTDGTWNKARSSVAFSSVDKGLSLQVLELARSLGERAVIHSVNSHGFGRDVTSYPVTWTPVNFNPFRLSRKAERVTLGKRCNSHRRLIKSVDRVEAVPTQCIQVDSHDRTYLCGEQMVPTHNTGANAVKFGMVEIAAQMAIYAHASHWWDGEKLHPMPKVDQALGVVFHMPAGEGTCTLYGVDLVTGWEIAKHCVETRRLRSVSGLATELTAVSTVNIERDLAVRERVRDIVRALEGADLPHPWPAGIAPIKRQSDPYSDDELDAIDRWCDRCAPSTTAPAH